MACSGIDDCETHIFDGTNFALWKNHMLDHFRAKGPKFLWVVTNGLTHNLDHKNLTEARKVHFELDCEAYCYLMRSLSFELFDRINSKGTAYEMWESIKHTFGDSSKWDDRKFKKEEPKVEAHEDVEHDHNLAIVDDCSTSWSSDDNDVSTTSSLDNIDDDATSEANDDTTSCTLDGEDDGSCSSHDYVATTSPSTTPHSFMSQGDTKVYNANVVDYVVSYDELFSRLASMTVSLEIDKAKTLKFENENSFLKTTCEQQKHLLYVTTCSHEELKIVHEELCDAHANLSSSLGSNDQSHSVTNPCDVGKKHVSTSCDNLLSMPCSSHLDACSTSMYCETNLLKENNKLNEQVKNLSNKLERCYYSKVTFEHILKTQRNYEDDKGREKARKENKLSHTMCYQCHEAGHLANGCPNIKKLKKMKEEERLKHVKCFKCRDWGHLTSMCPTKLLVKQQVKPQPKPQVEQEKTPQAQVKINHDGDDLMKKKKTRRGGRARHPMQIQDAKMMSKDQDKKRDLAHIKFFKCGDMGHFASKCPNKLGKKAQATLKRQGNEKHNMSKDEKAQAKRMWYLCRERGHMAHSCPLGNNSKPISIDDDIVLRKDGNGTSLDAIAKHPATHTKASPKYVAPNLRGPKLVWVPSKSE
ncbi:hypothetical protein BDA96_03G174000 [Sorghum bicolor]|uniref:CCHC-type domain-containing protein n=2 Tax=Sorghum bicolor TaxID=4558 RepID=A0A921UMK0_SORBI|nr:hypothetical protein BDA96_03G174000 [Sorghum bicolor]OQU86859.1 hypothetical protein SORBI_3003G165551 [Sorghum bicolor]